tara:strand:+ start:324 stop:1175 length:852 start_codon:yes stop_codon:yes gene_type:complete
MFSIVIPTFNNLDYLKLCLTSIKNNSNYDHEIIIHINQGNDGTKKFLENNRYKFTYSDQNVGLCSAVNIASKISTKKYIIYAHDDMYFCPNWDKVLNSEISGYSNDLFYLSATMIEPNSGHIKFNCGEIPNNFNEKKLIENLDNLTFYDFQGSHFAPHLISKRLWDEVGGFSEEFNPGKCSDPDLNMKLWKNGVRIFKGINNFKVYHFSSVTINKQRKIKLNNGHITFLKKWKITDKFFKKHYLRYLTVYNGPLRDPNKNIIYFLELIICKVKMFFYILTNKK